MSFRLSKKIPNQSRMVTEKKEVKKKYFFILEGEKTEPIYMREVTKHKKESLIDILILERIQPSHSNQFKITASIQKYLRKNAQLDQQSKDALLRLSDAYEEGEISETDLIDSLDGILGDMKDSFITDYNDNVIEQIRVLNELNNYEEGFDKICLILDRDYRSFKDYQYDDVLRICRENNFMLGITNPNFEFYLLLHINNAKQYNVSELLGNPNRTRSKKFVEYELNDALKSFGQSYRKEKYDPAFFVNKFSDFLVNIDGYETDNDKLKDKLGSSVHEIMKKIL